MPLLKETLDTAMRFETDDGLRRYVAKRMPEQNEAGSRILASVLELPDSQLRDALKLLLADIE